jgi:hypothetical protein
MTTETVSNLVLSFRKKPVVIQAVRVEHLLQYAQSNWKGLPDWVIGEYDKGNIIFTAHQILIQTLEGRMTAENSDWLIQGVKGEIYPCKPDIFEATYDPVELGSASY